MRNGMKKAVGFLLALCLGISVTACGNNGSEESEKTVQSAAVTEHAKKEGEMKIKFMAGGQEFAATLEDNPTSRAFMEKLPTKLKMENLYEREMCYHYPEALPAGTLRDDNYQVGDIIYWPPRHSFVILYKQNGEKFERQHLGHIDSGDLSIFNNAGDMEIEFTKQ